MLELSQKNIFINQRRKFANNNNIAVLSGMPFFIVEYLGKTIIENLDSKISSRYTLNCDINKKS